MRAMSHPAAAPLGSPDRPLPSTARALLAPRLAAPAGDVAPGLRGMGTPADRGHAGHDHLVHERDADPRLEDLGGQLSLGHFLSGGVDHLDLGHQADPPVGAFTADRTMTSPPDGPGTAPRRSRRFRSASAWITSRFRK